MAHYVNRRGYWSLEESFREGKRVKKRVLEYYGKRKPFNILTDVDWQYTMRGDGAVFNEPPAPEEKPALQQAVVQSAAPEPQATSNEVFGSQAPAEEAPAEPSSDASGESEAGSEGGS